MDESKQLLIDYFNKQYNHHSQRKRDAKTSYNLDLFSYEKGRMHSYEHIVDMLIDDELKIKEITRLKENLNG